MLSKPQPVRLTLVNSESNDQKRFSGRSLAKSLGALFAVGSALVLGSASNANTLPPKDGVKELEIRVEKIQKKLDHPPGTGATQSDGSSKSMPTVNWVNWWHKWHNWHNWHPGWGNGGWHRWHNWHNW
jgi:hypothetical protein